MTMSNGFKSSAVALVRLLFPMYFIEDRPGPMLNFRRFLLIVVNCIMELWRESEGGSLNVPII